VLKIIGTLCGQQMFVTGSKKGSFQIYHIQSGTLVADIENAHYFDITDIDLSPEHDLLISGGKDSKVRVWSVADLMRNSDKYLCEFGDASSEITAVKFSPMG
jgi:WD40 repeat protein